MTFSQYAQQRGDLVNNWNNVLAYRANPNDPRWATDPNVANISNSFASLNDYLQADAGGQLTADAGSPPASQPATGNGSSNTGSLGGAISGLTVPNIPANGGLIANVTNYAPGELGAMVNNTLANGVQMANGAGNTHAVQGGSQTGQYVTNQAQTGQQQQVGQQTGTSQQTGSQQTAQQQTGQQTTAVDASQYGLGSLLNSMTGQAGAADQARTSFLTGLMNNDPTYQANVTRAVRQATSGPSMVGTGQNANDRAAAYAAEAVTNNSLQNRLNAASQLAGPTASSTALGAAAPYAGTTTSSSQNTLGSALNNLTENTSQQTQGTTNSAQNQSTAGNATGSSLGITTGQTPQQQSSGGCFACTAYVKLHEMHPGVIRRAVKWKLENLHRFKTSLLGYSFYGPRLAKWILSSPFFARNFKPVARAVLYEEYRLATHRVRFRTLPWLAHAAFHYGSQVFAPWGQFGNYNSQIEGLLVEQQLYFSWRSV